MNFMPWPKKVPAPTGPELLTTFLINLSINLEPERNLGPGFLLKLRNRVMKILTKAISESKFS